MPGAPRPPIAPVLGAGGGGATAGALIVSARDGVLALGAVTAGAVVVGLALALAGGVVLVMAGSGAIGVVVSTGTGAVMACAVSTVCVESIAAVSGALPRPSIHQASNSTTAMPITQGNQLRSGAFVPGVGDVLMIILR